MAERIIADLPKSARERIRISLRERSGDLGCDVRVATRNGQGAFHETPKGLRIPVAQLDDVIAALQDAKRLAGRKGE